ncbi:Uncharacterised protein [Vibrio cholerae]|nr:Uncharacterised protein [Vibrio cholerae]
MGNKSHWIRLVSHSIPHHSLIWIRFIMHKQKGNSSQALPQP